MQNHALLLQGVCADQCKVFGHHRYQTVEANEGALGELKKLFEAKAEHMHQTLALHLYTSVLSRLQVESYLYGLLSCSPWLRSIGVQQREPGVCIPNVDFCFWWEWVSFFGGRWKWGLIDYDTPLKL